MVLTDVRASGELATLSPDGLERHEQQSKEQVRKNRKVRAQAYTRVHGYGRVPAPSLRISQVFYLRPQFGNLHSSPGQRIS